MKYLLAIALFAMATALPEPVRLLQPVQLAQPDIAPLMVPQEVMDQVATKVQIVDAPVEADATNYAVNFVDVAPEIADAPVEASYAVKFVDEVPQAAEAPVEASDFAVKFVDAAPDTAEAPVEASDFAVKFVDAAPETAEAPVEARDFAIKILDEVPQAADSPVEATNAVKFVDVVPADDETPSYIPSDTLKVQIIDIPLPNSVVMPLAVVIPDTVSYVDFGVKVVDVADADEETPYFYPPMRYPDPMWR